MAISFVGQTSAAATSVALPGSLATKDLILVFAFRNTTTAPSLPAGFTNIFSQSANGVSFRLGYKFATSPSDTSGTWTNANLVVASIYRGVSAIGGAGSNTNASAASTTVPGIGAFSSSLGNSWAVSFGGSLQTTSMATPGSTTLRGTPQTGTGCMALSFDSNAGVTSWAQHTSTNGTSAAGGGGSVELIAAVTNYDFESAPAFTAAQTADNWIDGTATGSTVNNYGWWASPRATAIAVRFDPTKSHGGSESLKVSTTDATGRARVFNAIASAGAVTGSSANLPYLIPVLPNTSYTFTAWAQSNNAAAGGVFIEIVELDSSFVVGTSTASNKLSGTVSIWTQLTVTVTTGATTAFVALDMQNAVAGNISDAWFDDLAFGLAGSVITNTQSTTSRIANNLTKTQPATARIAKTVNKTQSAAGRIAVNLTKNQPATARISKNFSVTQPATARIANIRSATQSATARIQKVATKAQTATARIANSFTKTQTSIARIANSPTKTQTAVSRIAVVTTKTQTSTARIQKTVTKTQLATARIQLPLAKTQTATSRIAIKATKTQASTARIATGLTKTQSATARIIQTGSSIKTQTATARIAVNRASTQGAIARISISRATTQTAVSRISNTRTKTQVAAARIAARFSKTQTATAAIIQNEKHAAISLTLTSPAVSVILADPISVELMPVPSVTLALKSPSVTMALPTNILEVKLSEPSVSVTLT